MVARITLDRTEKSMAGLLKTTGQGWGNGFHYGACPAKDSDVITNMGRDDIECLPCARSWTSSGFWTARATTPTKYAWCASKSCTPSWTRSSEEYPRRVVDAFRQAKLRVDPRFDYEDACKDLNNAR